jgi:hypothetical protein
MAGFDLATEVKRRSTQLLFLPFMAPCECVFAEAHLKISDIFAIFALKFYVTCLKNISNNKAYPEEVSNSGKEN